jgi:hypothetical protein
MFDTNTTYLVEAIILLLIIYYVYRQINSLKSELHTVKNKLHLMETFILNSADPSSSKPQPRPPSKPQPKPPSKPQPKPPSKPQPKPPSKPKPQNIIFKNQQPSVHVLLKTQIPTGEPNKIEEINEDVIEEINEDVIEEINEEVSGGDIKVGEVIEEVKVKEVSEQVEVNVVNNSDLDKMLEDELADVE